LYDLVLPFQNYCKSKIIIDIIPLSPVGCGAPSRVHPAREKGKTPLHS
jgi:hypothetical protein